MTIKGIGNRTEDEDDTADQIDPVKTDVEASDDKIACPRRCGTWYIRQRKYGNKK